MTVYSRDILLSQSELVHCSVSDSNCCFLTSYRFLRRQLRWSSVLISFNVFPQFVVLHTVKVFSVVNESEIDVFLEFPCLFCDRPDVGNEISNSSAFSNSNLYIWKFLVHILLKPSLKDFEHYYLARM